MAQWSPWDTPKPAASPFDSKKVKASFEKYSPLVQVADDRLDFQTALDKPAATGWYSDSSLHSGHNGKSFASNNRSVMPSASSPSNSDGTDITTNEFLTRYAKLKDLDAAKNELFEDLLCQYQHLTEKYSQLNAHHDREREYNRVAQRREKMCHENIRRLEALLDCDPCILVLLDGDAMMFSDDLVKQGVLGGQKAATMLEDAVLAHASETIPNLPAETRVVVRVYANFEKLACFGDRDSIIDEFAMGFVQGKPLFDFVNVGCSSDHAVTKILETFKLHLRDFHCRQILLGCSNESAYMRMLDDNATNQQALIRVTILEGFPLDSELKDLPFRRTKFDNIFQTTRTNHYGGSFSSGSNGSPLSGPPGMLGRQLIQMSFKDVKEFTPRGLPAALAAEVSSASPKASPNLKWASIAARPAPVSSPSPQPQHVAAAVIGTSNTPRNRKGQRVDPVIKHDKAEVDRVKKLKMCNVHYLRGECPYGDGCTHIHNYKPTPAETQTLRLVARMAPCMNGSECDDVKCIYGHICPAPEGRDGKDCIFGEACRFPTALHKVDRVIIKTVKV